MKSYNQARKDPFSVDVPKVDENKQPFFERIEKLRYV
jgi:hypothetical protein